MYKTDKQTAALVGNILTRMKEVGLVSRFEQDGIGAFDPHSHWRWRITLDGPTPKHMVLDLTNMLDQKRELQDTSIEHMTWLANYIFDEILNLSQQQVREVRKVLRTCAADARKKVAY